jgi:hypothetical protein
MNFIIGMSIASYYAANKVVSKIPVPPNPVTYVKDKVSNYKENKKLQTYEKEKSKIKDRRNSIKQKYLS